MLSLEVHGELVALIGAVHRLIAAATERAPVEEIELRVAAARTSAEKLERMTGASFVSLRRHMNWLERRHREGHPSLADGDIRDLRDRDLAEAVKVVTDWTARLLDKGLVAAITRSWEAQDYDGTVRDAFIELEARMNALATTKPGETLFGRRLVSRLFDPKQPPAMGAQGFMGKLGTNEVAPASSSGEASDSSETPPRTAPSLTPATRRPTSSTSSTCASASSRRCALSRPPSYFLRKNGAPAVPVGEVTR